jgi:hypothetical protein
MNSPITVNKKNKKQIYNSKNTIHYLGRELLSVTL